MDGTSNASSSAICASGQDSYDQLTAIIDEENAMHDDDLALIAEVLAANPSFEDGIAHYEAEVDGRTLAVESISASEGDVFTGTLTDENGDEHEVLSGVTTDSVRDGTLTLSFPDSDEIEVAFSENVAGRQIVRTVGSHEAVLDITESDVRLVVDDVIAWWSLEDYAGVVLDNDVACFEGAAGSDDFCDTECSSDLIGKVAGDTSF